MNSGESIGAGIYAFVAIGIFALGLALAIVWITFPFMVRKMFRELIEIQRSQSQFLVSINNALQQSRQMSPGTLACKCNVCSTLIQFDFSQLGQTVACPKCGMETKLYQAESARP